MCRKYNECGFPYTSIVMVNENNEICNGCECLYLEETTEMYQKMILSVKEMEPRWNVQNVNFLFGDHKMK